MSLSFPALISAVPLLLIADDWSGDDSLTGGVSRPAPRLRLVPDDGTAAGLEEAETASDLGS